MDYITRKSMKMLTDSELKEKKKEVESAALVIVLI